MKLLRKFSKKHYFKRIVVYFLACSMLLNTPIPVALAGPEGAQVVNGQVSFQQNGSNTVITASDKSIINYSSFDIARPEIVEFIQPGSSASVLNRILSANPTNINGTLLANGRVFFVNPAGVYIGAGARINVNQLVASGLNISNSDFINGRYNFAGGDGSVINSGDISAAEKVYLIGKQVANSGNISCPAGYVVMAAGDRVFLGEPGSDIVLEIEGTSLPELANPIDSGPGVLNEGSIDAAGGTIVLAAEGDIYSQAISNVGSLSVSVEAGDAGEIKLISTDGTVVNSGSVEATSDSGKGGIVQMLGDLIGLLDSAEIDASGSDGGGTVLIGGGYQGKGEVPTASRTYVSPESTIKADAIENGDGGKVIVWADEKTGFYGNISARGGIEGGDGGFAEVSGQELVYRGHTDLSAAQGEAGTLLLDPDTITIEGGTADGDDDEGGYSSSLLEDNSVTGTVAEDADPADFTIYESEIEDTSANIVLQAHDKIEASGNFQNQDLALQSGYDLTLQTRNDSGDATSDIGIDLANSTEGTDLEIITSGGGSITIETGVLGAVSPQAADITLCKLTSTGTGNIDIAATGAVTVDGEINSGGDLTINGSSVGLYADLAAAGSLSGDNTAVAVGWLGISSNGSIQDAIDIAKDGAVPADNVTITVEDGTYTEDLTIDKANLTLQSASGRDNTTIQLVDGVGIDIGSSGNGFTLGGAVADGFEITSGGATTFDIQLTNGPSDVEISWNTIDTTGNASMGISVGAAGATGLNVNNNIFTAGDLGDGSLWGPYMVDVSVTDNTFTGPAVHAASGYAVEFAGVTGTSFIQDNIISNYGMGIAVFNGTGTSGLTISGNQVSNSTNGIRLGQYSPGVNGDMTTVTVTENTLSNNTIGLRINNGANVKASNFTIQENSFLGNTTGLANQHTSESVTAEQNYWGNVDGPSGIGPGSGDPITEVAADSVDYSPWWGGDYIDDAHATSWIWGTDDSIQDAIDLASTTVADRINVTAGTYSETVNVDKQLDGLYFMGGASSEIDGTLSLTNDSANWGGGVLGIHTENQNLTLNSVTDPAAGEHSLTVNTGNGTTYLDENVTVGNDLTLESNTEVAADKKLDAGRDIILTDGKNINGAGALTLEADRHITLGGASGGNADAAGKLTLTADALVGGTGDLHAYGTVKTSAADIDADGVNLTFEDVVEAATGMNLAATGKLDAKSTLEAKGGDVELYASDDAGKRINLGDDVTASQDILLKNNTEVAAGIKLKASNNVVLTDGKTLTGTDSLTIEATGGEIQAAGAGSIISVTGSLLTLIQSLDLDLADFTFANQSNTDLTLQSYDGSVTADNTKAANAADSWKSIMATAEDNIVLQGTGDIKIGGDLTSYSGGVSIISDTGGIYDAGSYDYGMMSGTTLDNVAITGYSNDAFGTGVGLPGDTDQKAAIQIISKENLNLGPGTELTANGVYYGGTVASDNRDSVVFKSEEPDSGDAIDVAIYLGTKEITSNIEMGSGNVFIENLDVATEKVGTLVFDAGDTVTFTDIFEDSLKPGNGSSTVKRIEAVSRITSTLTTAVEQDRFPYGDNPENLADGQFVKNSGVYVLRGTPNGKLFTLAEILKITDPVPLVPPKPMEPEVRGEVEGPDTEALRRLLEQLGLGEQPELAKAYPPSLNTDLDLYKAAERLNGLVPVLQNTNLIAAMDAIVVEVWRDVDSPLVPEQRAVIAQRIGDSPARGWLVAITDFADILKAMVGRSERESVDTVMATYVIPQMQAGVFHEQTVAFVETQLIPVGG